jgi:hypothetical protein
MIPFAIPMGAGSSAISFVAKGTDGTATDTGALPVGWVADQTAIFAIASRNNVVPTFPTHSTPAGWTLVGTAVGVEGTSQTLRLSVYRRRLVALDTNPQAVTADATDSNTSIITYSGVHATPIEAAVTDGGVTPTLNPTYQEVTTLGPNRIIVQVLASLKNGTITGSTPGFYWSERTDLDSGSSSYIRIDDRRVYPAGTNTPVTYPTIGGASSAITRAWAKVAFALIPA